MKSLKLQNLILIEKAEIHFGPGLNIITGETGSGKSAILSAIQLISGQRADSSCIRKGADLAIIEAEFEGPTYIRREIHRSGKNRCFIDESQVSLSTLKERSEIEMIDQNSSQLIFTEQKRMLDTFANLLEKVQDYEISLAALRSQEVELQKLLQTPKERELEWAEKDLRAIEEINWENGEEEKLTEEHHFLTHAQDTAEKMSLASYLLTEENLIPSLKKVLSSLEQCSRIDPKIGPMAKSMKSALLEIDECAQEVQSYSDKINADPARLGVVEKKIAIIESLKRRFGPHIQEQKAKLLETIEHLSSLDAQIAQLQGSIDVLKRENRDKAALITEKRREAAQKFGPIVLSELKELNLPHAKFEIVVGEALTEVHFLFSANPGQGPLPLEQCASGGELSRLLLAIMVVLSTGNSTLVFDEIDSNVGGHTATILGEKLKLLGSKRQVICVTHFVQVAKCAPDHFLVSKATKEGNAFTSIAKLSEKEKENEYHRMLGTKP